MRACRPLIRKAFAKQLRFLLGNRNHPSLHAKKHSDALDVWQGRVAPLKEPRALAGRN
ncbi:MAG: hypothetical protein WA324_10895 [Bryobacteraceae bacterium]